MLNFPVEKPPLSISAKSGIMPKITLNNNQTRMRFAATLSRD